MATKGVFSFQMSNSESDSRDGSPFPELEQSPEPVIFSGQASLKVSLSYGRLQEPQQASSAMPPVDQTPGAHRPGSPDLKQRYSPISELNAKERQKIVELDIYELDLKKYPEIKEFSKKHIKKVTAKR